MKGKLIAKTPTAKDKFNSDTLVVYKDTVCKIANWWDGLAVQFNGETKVTPSELQLLYVKTAKKTYPLNIFNNSINQYRFAVERQLINKAVEIEVENICVYRSDPMGCSQFDRYIDYANIISKHLLLMYPEDFILKTFKVSPEILRANLEAYKKIK